MSHSVNDGPPETSLSPVVLLGPTLSKVQRNATSGIYSEVVVHPLNDPQFAATRVGRLTSSTIARLSASLVMKSELP